MLNYIIIFFKYEFMYELVKLNDIIYVDILNNVICIYDFNIIILKSFI